ncbi:hypothetical protein DPEC_G00124490 [Dallia pectoralis]|uniref:Uncharacterized protein n=1 Tax=Dallia pectoralis TaxID=75939 RepID=A0ACC2GRB1_DALPE|nr:hypothetical protein DPEC_G00124490 [Dallia pectoralis]
MDIAKWDAVCCWQQHGCLFHKIMAGGLDRFTVGYVVYTETREREGVQNQDVSSADSTKLAGDLVVDLVVVPSNRWDVDVASTAEAHPDVHTSYIRLGLSEWSSSRQLLAPRGTHHHLSPATTASLTQTSSYHPLSLLRQDEQ